LKTLRVISIFLNHDLKSFPREVPKVSKNNMFLTLLKTSKLEILRGSEGRFFPDHILIEFEIPNNVKIKEFKVDDLKGIDWKKTPYGRETQNLADPYVKSNEYFAINHQQITPL